MGRTVRFSREKIIQAACDLVRERGAEALNARSLAGYLGCSTQPLFREFSSMEEIKRAAMEAAMRRYEAAVEQARDPENKQYLAMGMAYIRFASQEKQLFKWLFMRDRHAERPGDGPEDRSAGQVRGAASRVSGLPEQQMDRFLLHMWIYVHGIASMVATDFLVLPEETLREMVKEAYAAIVARFRGEA